MTATLNGQRREIVTWTVRDEKAIRAEIDQNAKRAQELRLSGQGLEARAKDAERERLWEEARAAFAGCRNPTLEFERWERRVFRTDADSRGN